MKLLLMVLLLLLVSLTANARFGGGSGGSRSSFSSSSRSSFSPSSSSRTSFGGATRSAPVTITRPSAPAPQASTRSTTVIHNTTVVNRGSNSNGLVTGMLIGSALSHPRTQVVYVNGQPQQVYVDNNGQPVQQPVVVVQESHGVLWPIALVFVVVVLIFLSPLIF